MKRAVLNIVAGDKGRAEHAITRENHRSYADRCGAEYVVIQREHAPKYSPAIKYLANKVTPDYDQTLFLDLDCIVTPQCPNIFDEVPLGYWGVIDENGLARFHELENDQTQRHANALCDALHLPYVYLTRHINSGVMVMPPNSADYYFPPKYPVPSNYWAVEQLYLSINLQLHDAPLKELDRRFNWCWCHKRFEEDMHRAFIIHWGGKHDRLENLNACSMISKDQRNFDSPLHLPLR